MTLLVMIIKTIHYNNKRHECHQTGFPLFAFISYITDEQIKQAEKFGKNSLWNVEGVADRLLHNIML